MVTFCRPPDKITVTALCGRPERLATSAWVNPLASAALSTASLHDLK